MLLPTLTQDEVRFVQLCKALSNPIRYQMVRYMVAHPQCITGELVEFTALAQSTVSQHLKVLREVGLVQGTIDGPAVCYCLNAATLRWFQNQLNGVVEEFTPACC